MKLAGFTCYSHVVPPISVLDLARHEELNEVAECTLEAELGLALGVVEQAHGGVGGFGGVCRLHKEVQGEE